MSDHDPAGDAVKPAAIPADDQAVEESTTADQRVDRDDVRALLEQVGERRGIDPVGARGIALDARARARVGEYRAEEAEALYHLASISHHEGQTDDAFAFAAEAVDIGESLGPSLTLAWSLYLLGVVHYQSSNYADALTACRRALQIYRATGDLINEGKILHTVAAIHQSMGDYDQAVATYENALAANEPLGRKDLDAMVMGNLARIRGRRGEYLPAVSLGRKAVDIARDHAPHLVGGLLADLAEAYVGLGDHASAALCFAEARADWEHRAATGGELSPAEQIGVMVAEGRVALRMGQHDEAIASLSAALDLADRTDVRETELEIHDHLATAYKQAGRYTEALEHRERHFALHREIFRDTTDLRVRTLQIVHDNEVSRHRAEITRLTTSQLVSTFATDHSDVDAYHLEAYERLASLAEFRGGNTTRHTGAVGDLSAEIAHAIGEPPEWCERLRLAARLHDIGKVGVSDVVLLKPGPLTVEEFEEVKQHTVLGQRVLAGVSTDLFKLAAEVAWSHHEWWDGSGYPNGLSETSIPLSGRIVAIADVFDSLITRRVYKREWEIPEAVQFVSSGAGNQFDPHLVETFVQVMRLRHADID